MSIIRRSRPTFVHVIGDHDGNRNYPAPAGLYFALISR
jgi:hypothetical protein